jgi:hypothetical protein
MNSIKYFIFAMIGIISTMALMLVSVIIAEFVIEPGETTVIVEQRGKILQIDNCRKTKSSFRCRVLTDKLIFKSIDITDFPGYTVSINDNISAMWKKNNLREKFFLCKNNKCTAQTTCEWWMPCYKK